MDDVSQELVENYFVHGDEWGHSRLFRCAAGHAALSMGSSPIPERGGTCTRGFRGSPPCGQKMKPFLPDDEGLSQLQWAKRLLKRQSRTIEDLSAKLALAERR